MYLGVDGGGTSCRVRIQDENGRVLGEADSGPATTRIGVEKAWRSIMDASEAAAAQARLRQEDFSRMHAGIGLAGLGRRGRKRRSGRSRIHLRPLSSSTTAWLPALAPTAARTGQSW